MQDAVKVVLRKKFMVNVFLLNAYIETKEDLKSII